MTTRRWLALACLWMTTLFWSVAGIPTVGAADPVEPACPPGSESDSADEQLTAQANAASTSDDEPCPPDGMGRVRPGDSSRSAMARNVATVAAAGGLIVIGAFVFRFAHRAKLTG